MAASFEDVLNSRAFTFLVGEDELPLVVHEAALADQSPALDALMRGGMSEGVAAKATWNDVDKGTFIRFAHFAYTGDYSVPTMVIRSDDQPIEAEVRVISDPDTILWGRSEVARPEVVDDGWGNFGAQVKSKKKSRLREESPPPKAPLITFRSLSYPLRKNRKDFADTYSPTTTWGLESEENIGEVLLLHASLYVLAEKWGVEDLKMLTLSKLHQTLSSIDLDANKVPYVAELARYTYSDEHTPDLTNGVDQLRELVCLYIVANAEVTAKDAVFTELMEAGGALSRDLWKEMAIRTSGGK